MKITQNGQYPFYRPWDSGLAKQSLQDSWEGEFSILDLQLGSACNAHCRHCDSSCSYSTVNRFTKLPCSSGIILRPLMVLMSVPQLFPCGIISTSCPSCFTKP